MKVTKIRLVGSWTMQITGVQVLPSVTPICFYQDWVLNLFLIFHMTLERVLLKPATTDQPTTFHQPTDQPTDYHQNS